MSVYHKINSASEITLYLAFMCGKSAETSFILEHAYRHCVGICLATLHRAPGWQRCVEPTQHKKCNTIVSYLPHTIGARRRSTNFVQRYVTKAQKFKQSP